VGNDIMIEEYLHNCLFFTASKLSRIITKMAEEEFSITGLSPAYAFLIMLVNDKPDITQKELCGHLHLTQSTVTRFIDKLESKGLVTRRTDGKNSHINTTKKGKQLQGNIEKSWERLYERYSAILGKEEGDLLTQLTDEAGFKLDSE